MSDRREHPDVVAARKRHEEAWRAAEHAPLPDYVHLELHEHRWRKQLFVKARRLVPGHVVGTMLTEGWAPERTAEEFDLPLEAVLEILDYSGRRPDLIAAENAVDAAAVRGLPSTSNAEVNSPMTVGELMATLQGLDPNMGVLIPGYERHWDPLEVVRVENALRFDEAYNYDGLYHAYERGKNVGTPHVMLASHRRLPHAEGMG